MRKSFHSTECKDKTRKKNDEGLMFLSFHDFYDYDGMYYMIEWWIVRFWISWKMCTFHFQFNWVLSCIAVYCR